MLHRAVLLFVFAGPVLAQTPAPQAATLPTIVVEGRVVDLRGEGVPVAKVTVTSTEETEVLARGVADGEGYFRIARVPTAEWYRVFADSEGHCRGVDILRGEPSPLRIEVHDAAAVRGRLTNRAGEPVAGAIVRAMSAMRILFGVCVDATTDADGHFELHGVPLGLVQLAAVVAGEGLALQTHVVAGDTEMALQTGNEPTTTLHLVVTGMPAESIAALCNTSIVPYGGARLSRLPPPWDRPSFEANGVCELSPVPQGCTYLVIPRAQGFAFEPRERRAKAGAQPIVMEFATRPVGSSELRCPVRLLDGNGKPLAGVPLSMRAANGGERAQATTDAAGCATFDSPHGVGTKVIVHSTDDRWVLDQHKNASLPGGRDGEALSRHECTVDPSQVLELRAVAACLVAGRLLRPDGRPVAFVRLQLEESGQDRWPRWLPFARATTDRDGRYRFGGLHHLADPVRVTVEGADGSLAGEPIALTEPGTTVAEPDLQLQAPATIEGTVVDALQQPAPGVRVWLRDWEFEHKGQKSASIVEVVTDRLGRYRFVGVPPGGKWLQLLVAEQNSSERAVEPFEVEAGKTYVHDLQVPAR